LPSCSSISARVKLMHSNMYTSILLMCTAAVTYYAHCGQDCGAVTAAACALVTVFAPNSTISHTHTHTHIYIYIYICVHL
jgi:hypothetical protein